MDETDALAVTAVEALETADRARSLWSDADRAWATRAAAEVVGASATPAVFVARRARLALERVGERTKALSRALRSLRWRPWVGVALVVAAFVLGVAIDRIGGAQRVSVLESPVLPLLVWNVAVYVLLAVGFVVRYGDARAPGPLQQAVIRVAGRGLASTREVAANADAAAQATAAFVRSWIERAGPLYAARAARILHLAAAALALGVIAGLYLRGLAFEYRATWESTFLDADFVRRVLAIGYAPGAFVTGIAVPDTAAVAAIRAPGSENAARWLHLMAATLAVVVIVPRLVLAAGTWLVERYRARRLLPGFDTPYYARLLRVLRGGPVEVHVVPYSYALPAGAAAALETMLARACGGSVHVTVDAPVAYGGEDALPGQASAAGTARVIALFNATATPEAEAHGAFVAALARSAAEPPLVIVDEAAFNARWRGDDGKREGRRKLWRDFCAELDVTPVFVDSSAPDVATAAQSFEAAWERGGR